MQHQPIQLPPRSLEDLQHRQTMLRRDLIAIADTHDSIRAKLNKINRLHNLSNLFIFIVGLGLGLLLAQFIRW